ncbi:Zinc finger SWIM domain-containing protein 7 [Nymphaea thermarum]|nr:Zinc finger SWIM domain-containing protein 7 [Nymphaea thermarum]
MLISVAVWSLLTVSACIRIPAKHAYLSWIHRAAHVDGPEELRVTQRQLHQHFLPSVVFNDVGGRGMRRAVVVGESRRKEEYICFPAHHCTCYSFFYDVVNKAEQLRCKHQLAARLAEVVQAYTEVRVPDEELAVILSRL